MVYKSIKNLMLTLKSPFLVVLFKYWKYDFVRQFLRNGSTKLQKFCIPFCSKCQALTTKMSKCFTYFSLCPELQLSKVITVSRGVYSTLVLEGLMKQWIMGNAKTMKNRRVCYLCVHELSRLNPDGRKSNVEECIFDYMASHIECRSSKNSLLQCYFLVILPAGNPLLYLL